MQNNVDAFTALGGKFVSDPSVIVKKMSGIKAFIFDWDGVFNNGQKLRAEAAALAR